MKNGMEFHRFSYYNEIDRLQMKFFCRLVFIPMLSAILLIENLFLDRILGWYEEKTVDFVLWICYNDEQNKKIEISRKREIFILQKLFGKKTGKIPCFQAAFFYKQNP